MDADDHYGKYLYAWLIYGFFMALNDAFDLWFFVQLYCVFFAIDPDFFDRALRLHKKNQHRNWFSHSVFYPITGYWVFHNLWNLAMAKLIGVMMFYVVGVHLICDFILVREIKENPPEEVISQGLETANQKPKDLIGTATIKFFGHDLRKRGSLVYIFLNIAAVISYMIWAL